MKASIKDALITELKAQKRSEELIDKFIERMQRHIAISEASSQANIARNVPLNGSTAIHLNDLIKASDKMVKALSFINTDEELKIRLQPEFRELQLNFNPIDLVKTIKNIHLAATATKKYQSATGDEYKAPYHLRPENKGRRITPYREIELLILLRGALNEFFPDIKPSKKQKDTAPFFKLAGTLLEKKDPSRNIDKMLDYVTQDN